MDLPAVIAEATAVLTAAGVPTPGEDARRLVQHVVGAATQVDDPAGVAALVQRRADREPMQYLLGRASFRGLTLAVGPGVFVPRAETEQTVQLAIDALAAAGAHPVGVDLGTGSGAVALAMAAEVPQATVVGVEVALEAFAWAERNARGVDNVRMLLGDLADALPERDGAVDVVMSNPPYIPTGMVPREVEVRRHSPAVALFGGTDGMDVLRQVSTTARRLLRIGGTLVIEHGEQQAAAVAAILVADGWRDPATHRDAAGRDRATTARR
ncbi:peptide chain release factor N(5)-glutamine methyltransferase [Nakamurella deserti]|uniref:peptide chain release factor N(5)-glutamine methyltransferase n=1 Tax=Nakamurella deserti TaxID=2164074 RepID=UPI000DBE52E9|nr:peptide chain release factor N(5)-glutamine methyltransferase [Nakamurella deserti]